MQPSLMLQHYASPTVQLPSLDSTCWPLAFMLPALAGHQAQQSGTTQRVLIGPGLPTIPKRLHDRMLRWKYIDMAELLPANSTHDASLPDADAHRFAFFLGCEVIHHKRRQVENILEWVRCFPTYMATMTRQYPESTGGMIAQLQLVVKTSHQYDGKYWRSYDTHFRVTAAATGNRDWSRMDTDLYTRFFTGHAKTVVACTHCDGTTHSTDDLQPTRRGRSGTMATPISYNQSAAKRQKKWHTQ